MPSINYACLIMILIVCHNIHRSHHFVLLLSEYILAQFNCIAELATMAEWSKSPCFKFKYRVTLRLQVQIPLRNTIVIA